MSSVRKSCPSSREKLNIIISPFARYVILSHCTMMIVIVPSLFVSLSVPRMYCLCNFVLPSTCLSPECIDCAILGCLQLVCPQNVLSVQFWAAFNLPVLRMYCLCNFGLPPNCLSSECIVCAILGCLQLACPQNVLSVQFWAAFNLSVLRMYCLCNFGLPSTCLSSECIVCNFGLPSTCLSSECIVCAILGCLQHVCPQNDTVMLLLSVQFWASLN